MNKIIYLVYIQNLSIFKFQKLSNLILDMSQKKTNGAQPVCVRPYRYPYY